MTDWSNLNHAYGSAEEIPALFAALSPHSTTKDWGDLWSCLCHQGTVYTASFAALPVLLDFAAQCKPNERFDVLMLAGAIVASEDVQGNRDELLAPVAWVVPQFQRLCREHIAAAKVARDKFIYQLQMARAFDGDSFWGQWLNHLVDGEFSGLCFQCGAELYLVIGEEGFFVTNEEWIHAMPAAHSAISPSQNLTDEAGQWMYVQAEQSGQTEVAEWVQYVFGSSACPVCATEFQISDVIRKGIDRKQDSD